MLVGCCQIQRRASRASAVLPLRCLHWDQSQAATRAEQSSSQPGHEQRSFSRGQGKRRGCTVLTSPQPLSKLQCSPAGCDGKHRMGRGMHALTSTPIPNSGAEQKGLGWPSLSCLLPVAVVQVLPDQCMGLHCPVRVHLRHVQVIDEVHELLGTRRSIISARLFLQRLLKHPCEEVEERAELPGDSLPQNKTDFSAQPDQMKDFRQEKAFWIPSALFFKPYLAC